MTIYTHAESNIRKTWLLIGLFSTIVIGLGWFFSYALNTPNILLIAVIFSVSSSWISYWYSDKLVLFLSAGRPIEKNDNPEFYRLVENLCITAGLPLPRIYIINETQPNAFATGRDPRHAVIAVTRGLLERLDKSELEGVLAHELSHIGNRDILLSTIVVTLVGVVSLIANFFLRSNFWHMNGNDREDRQLNALFIIIGVILALLSPIVASLIQLAISRKREFLADASGALLTRYPEGLARALDKISATDIPMRSAREATAHLYIASPFKGKQKGNWLIKLFMTHPPIEERIKALKGMSF